MQYSTTKCSTCLQGLSHPEVQNRSFCREIQTGRACERETQESVSMQQIYGLKHHGTFQSPALINKANPLWCAGHRPRVCSHVSAILNNKCKHTVTLEVCVVCVYLQSGVNWFFFLLPWILKLSFISTVFSTSILSFPVFLPYSSAKSAS